MLRITALILFAAIAAQAESPLQIEVIVHGGIPLNDTLRNATSSGVNKQPLAPVVSGGVEWSRGLIRIRPELRYVHFPYRYVGIGIDRPPNQFQFLIGVGFRKPRG